MSEIKKFEPREIWLSDYGLKLEPEAIREHVRNGGSLYMTEEPFMTDSGGYKAWISTQPSADTVKGIQSCLNMKHISQEITLNDNALGYIPAEMREHVLNGGKLYQIGYPENDKLFISVDKQPYGNLCTHVDVSDASYAGMQDDDFSRAVADIPVNDNGLDR